MFRTLRAFNPRISLQYFLYTRCKQANKNYWPTGFVKKCFDNRYWLHNVLDGNGYRSETHSVFTSNWGVVQCTEELEFLLRTRQSEVRGKVSSEDPFNLICRLLPSITRTVHLYTLRQPLSTVMSHTSNVKP